MPYNVRSEQNKLQYERETCRFPEFTCRNPEKDVCDDEGKEAPLK